MYNDYDESDSSIEDSGGNGTEESDELDEISVDEVDDNIDCIVEEIMTGTYLKKLVKRGKGQLVKDRIQVLILRSTTLERFCKSLSHPLKMMKDQFKQLNLENSPVQVMSYDNPLNIVELTDALTDFDPDYDPEASKKTHFNKISLINDFTKSSDHYRITEYTFEYLIHGKHSCDI